MTVLGVRHQGASRGYCEQHAESGMFDVDIRVYRQPGCTTPAGHGQDSTVTAKCCASQAEYRRCRHTNCVAFSSYGEEGTNTAEFCRQHVGEGTVPVQRSTCKHTSCATTASFAKKGARTTEIYSKHASDGMVHVEPRLYCLHPTCVYRASCGQEGGRALEYCGEHANVGMANISTNARGKRPTSECGSTSRANKRPRQPGDAPSVRSRKNKGGHGLPHSGRSAEGRSQVSNVQVGLRLCFLLRRHRRRALFRFLLMILCRATFFSSIFRGNLSLFFCT